MRWVIITRHIKTRGGHVFYYIPLNCLNYYRFEVQNEDGPKQEDLVGIFRTPYLDQSVRYILIIYSWNIRDTLLRSIV